LKPNISFLADLFARATFFRKALCSIIETHHCIAFKILHTLMLKYLLNTEQKPLTFVTHYEPDVIV